MSHRAFALSCRRPASAASKSQQLRLWRQRPAASAAAAEGEELLVVDLGGGRSVQLLRPAELAGPSGELSSLAPEALALLRQTSLYGAGDVVWPAGLALARLVAHCPSFVADRRVLELGCGLGLPSCAAALSGAAAVTVADRDAALLSLAARSVALNGGTVSPLNATFAELSPWPRDAAVLLGADILYDERTARDVAALLAALLAGPAAERALIADPQQREHREFFARACEAVGLLVQESPLPGAERCVLLHIVAASAS